jgi:hexosaminidase
MNENVDLPAVVPLPVRMERGVGTFTLTSGTRILAAADARGVGLHLAAALKPATGYTLTVKEAGAAADASAGSAILLSTEGADPQLGDEGYELIVEPRRVTLRAPKAAGLFYGAQTLLQLFPAEIYSPAPVAGIGWTATAVKIWDRPRFAWRGLHLDVSRHFMPVDFVKKYIDLIAFHRMNVLHWHLTDDQGWRLQIRKYPLLTEASARRDESPHKGDRDHGDGTPYGPFFYTQDEVRDIVAYAARRHVTVVPEIELPGHALAVLAAYPELACTPGPFKVCTRWGIEADVFCAGNDQTMAFLEDVLTEVLELFPSTFIHIGGDECCKQRWEQCPKCLERIRANGLANAHELQSWVIRHFDRFLSARGRRLIGWDEIVEGGLAPGAAVTSWRGDIGGVRAAQTGNDAVMSPGSHCYFDRYQSAAPGEPESWGGVLTLEDVYGYEPIPAGLDASLHKHILGAQGNAWTEYMWTPADVEFQVFPRATALAEAVWTPPAGRNFADFMTRMWQHTRRMDALGVNYRREPALINGWKPGELTAERIEREQARERARAAGAPTVAAEKPEILWTSDPIRPGDTVMIQGHAFSEDAVVEASPAPGKPMQKLRIVDRSEQCLKALLPADWKANAFTIRISTGAGRATALLNRPAYLFWVGDLGKRQTPGGRFRVCGRNMLGNPRKVRARLTAAAGFIDVPVEKAEAYALAAVLPADVPPGEYGLQVHNGWGGAAGWSDAIPFVVQHATPWPQTLFNVMDFGAVGDGLADDTAAVQAALAEAQAAGGGIVFFPRGRYEIRETLKVPRFTVLRGEKREWVELLWPDSPKPVALVRGTNSFGLEDLSLACRNYADGIISDDGTKPDAGNVFLRRLRVRAMRYEGLMGHEEAYRRFCESVAHETKDCNEVEGSITVQLGGENVEVTDCDLYGSARSLVLAAVTGGRVTGNQIYNGRLGWYCISGPDGLIFENNDIIGADLTSTGGSLNTFCDWRSCHDLYFAHNRVRTIFAHFREAITSDGGGGSHAGPIESAEGTTLVLAERHSVVPVKDGQHWHQDIWLETAKVGMGVYIMKGRGAGQWRRVVRQEGRTVEIDRPWVVNPDASSLVSIAALQENYLIIGNDITDAGIAVQTCGISINHVIAGNTCARASGYRVMGLNYGGLQPTWFCQMLENEILEGNGLVGRMGTAGPGDSQIAITGQEIPGLDVAMARGGVIRRNHLHNGARVELIGSVRDAVVEHNTIEHTSVGIKVETTVAGVLLRENAFRNVRRPLVRTEPPKA